MGLGYRPTCNLILSEERMVKKGKNSPIFRPITAYGFQLNTHEVPVQKENKYINCLAAMIFSALSTDAKLASRKVNEGN